MSRQTTTRRRTLDAAAATAPKTTVKPAINGQRRKLTSIPMSANEVADEDVPMVKANVPKDFTLQLDHHHHVRYTAGVQSMPADHLDHWWVKANGVTPA